MLLKTRDLKKYKMRKVFKIANIIAVCMPLLFFFVFFYWLLYFNLSWGDMPFPTSEARKVQGILIDNLLFISTFSIPITVVLFCCRFFLLKEKISLKLSILFLTEILFLFFLIWPFYLSIVDH